MPVNLFQNSAKSIPTSDEQIVRVDMDKSDIGGRKSHMPSQSKSDVLPINHVPNSGSNPGSK